MKQTHNDNNGKSSAKVRIIAIALSIIAAVSTAGVFAGYCFGFPRSRGRRVFRPLIFRRKKRTPTYGSDRHKQP